MKAEYSPEYLAQADHWAQIATKDAMIAEEEADILKEHGKDLLAMIMTELALHSDKQKCSESSLEREARTSKAWEIHRKGLYEAKRKAVELGAKRTNAERHWATVQSGLSYRKQEMSRISGAV